MNGNNDATVPIPEGETGSVKADGNLVFNSKNDGNELVYIVSNPDQQIEDKINELIDKYSDYNCEIDVNIDSDGFLNWTVKVLGPKDYTDGNNLVNNGNLSNDTNSDDSISEPLPPAFNPYDYINQDGSFNVDDFINDALENGWDYTTITGNNNIEEAWGDILDAYNSGNWDDFYNNAFSGAYTGNDSKNDDENYNGYDGINGDFNVFETGGGGGSAGSNNMWDNFLQDPSSYFRNQANGMINNNSYKGKIFTMNNKFGV